MQIKKKEKENVSSREILWLLKTSRDLEIMFAAVTQLVEGLHLTDIKGKNVSN
jgi:hypothetical protein